MISIVGIVAHQARTNPAKVYSSLVLSNINALTGSEATPGEEGGDDGSITNEETGDNDGPITNVETGGSKYEYPDGRPLSSKCNVYLDKDFLGIPIRCKVTVITCQGGGDGCNSKDCPKHPSISKPGSK